MAQKKLKRFGEIKTFPNVFEYPENMKGKWNQFFKNDNPIVLELACGKGEYTTGLATLFPEKNFIGVDIKGNRLWVGATYSLSNNLTNAAFLRTQIDKIDQYFAKDEVDEIWITFPDPQLRLSKANKRLTHPKFFRLYHLFLKKDGLINLKTDSPELYKFTNTVIELYGLEKQMDYDNLYKQQPLSATLKIQTHYEKLDIAKSASIFYLRFSLPEIIPDEDKKLEETLKQVVHER
jgi:tRNA (guanine-N7-)-methyltransferase